MLHYFIKVIISAVLIVIISEVAKRNSLIGAMLASVPFVSVLAIIWLYQETRDVVVVANLTSNIFWLVLPSLILFVLLPIFLIKFQWPFYPALTTSLATMISCYFMAINLMRYIL